MKKLKILVIGSINKDLVLETDRIPVSGESLIYSKNYNYMNGGKGANQVVAAARLGAETTFAGKVGSDLFGSELISALKGFGVCTDYMKAEKNINSGFAVIILEDNGKNRILVYPGSNMIWDIADVDEVMHQHFDAMIVQFEIPEDIIIYACQKACEKNLPFFVDAGPAQDFPIEKIYGADVLSPNETETFAMCKVIVRDIISAETASKILMERSKAKFIVIKAGESGAYLYNGNNIEHFSAYKVNAVDPTAAGDAFTAAMTIRYIESGDIREAIRFAMATGAVTVTKMGAQPSLPTLAEVEEFISKF